MNKSTKGQSSSIFLSKWNFIYKTFMCIIVGIFYSYFYFTSFFGDRLYPLIRGTLSGRTSNLWSNKHIWRNFSFSFQQFFSVSPVASLFRICNFFYGTISSHLRQKQVSTKLNVYVKDTATLVITFKRNFLTLFRVTFLDVAIFT